MVENCRDCAESSCGRCWRHSQTRLALPAVVAGSGALANRDEAILKLGARVADLESEVERMRGKLSDASAQWDRLKRSWSLCDDDGGGCEDCPLCIGEDGGDCDLSGCRTLLDVALSPAPVPTPKPEGERCERCNGHGRFINASPLGRSYDCPSCGGIGHSPVPGEGKP